MKIKAPAFMLPAALLSAALIAFVQQPRHARDFSPQGTVKRIQQLCVQFSVLSAPSWRSLSRELG
jgi:hypothetical protein